MVRAYEVWCKDLPREWSTVVNALNAGKAKYKTWLDLTDAWNDIPLTSMRSKALGKPVTTERLQRAAIHRGLAGIKAGVRVKVIGSGEGVVVDSDYGENFEVILDSGQEVHVHPSDLVVLATREG